MNDTEIEKVLRKAPKVRVPASLVEKLQADIVLPRAELNRTERNDWRPLFKRWVPALSFSAFLLASLVVIAVQVNVLAELRRENRQLQVAAADVERLQRESADSQVVEQLRLEQLRKDAAEVERLREEIAQLRPQAEEVASLRAENQQLKGRLQAARSTAAAGATEEDPFGEAREKARSIQCVSNMKQIGLGARMWANDHQEIMPPDFLTMQNELNTPKILVCPSDEGRTRARTWSEFAPANVSYEFLAPSVSEREPPNTVMTRCPIHGHVGLIDGSVHQSAWKRAVQKDGRWVVEPNAARQ